MNYKEGLKKINEMNICSDVMSYGPTPASVGTHGGDVDNSDWYAPGDARNLWGVPSKKNKKGKNKKNKQNFLLYRRAFAETMSEDVNADGVVLGCILYTEDVEYQRIIEDVIEKLKIPYSSDLNCVLIEGSDEYIQGVIQSIKGIITEDPFESGAVCALIAEMDLDYYSKSVKIEKRSHVE